MALSGKKRETYILVQLFLSADMRFGGIGTFLVSARRTGSYTTQKKSRLLETVYQDFVEDCFFPPHSQSSSATYHVFSRRKSWSALLINDHLGVL